MCRYACTRLPVQLWTTVSLPTRDRGHHGDPPLEITLNVAIIKLPWFKVELLETSKY